jgi:5-methylcytosine-specific restriction endonuclease McrA
VSVPEHHHWSFSRRLRLKARQRHREKFWEFHDKATYECPSCGEAHGDQKRVWEVHHKDGDALNGHIFNLVALCHTCHRQYHSSIATMEKVNEWKEGFLALGDGGEVHQPIVGLTDSSPTEAKEGEV